MTAVPSFSVRLMRRMHACTSPRLDLIVARELLSQAWRRSVQTGISLGYAWTFFLAPHETFVIILSAAHRILLRAGVYECGAYANAH